MLLAQTFLVAFIWCNFLTVSRKRGHFLHGTAMWLDRKRRQGILPVWVVKPLLLCETCLASVHGTLVFCLYYVLLWGGTDWEWYPPFVMGLAVANYGFWVILTWLEQHGDTGGNTVKHN